MKNDSIQEAETVCQSILLKIFYDIGIHIAISSPFFH